MLLNFFFCSSKASWSFAQMHSKKHSVQGTAVPLGLGGTLPVAFVAFVASAMLGGKQQQRLVSWKVQQLVVAQKVRHHCSRDPRALLETMAKPWWRSDVGSYHPPCVGFVHLSWSHQGKLICHDMFSIIVFHMKIETMLKCGWKHEANMPFHHSLPRVLKALGPKIAAAIQRLPLLRDIFSIPTWFQKKGMILRLKRLVSMHKTPRGALNEIPHMSLNLGGQSSTARLALGNSNIRIIFVVEQLSTRNFSWLIPINRLSFADKGLKGTLAEGSEHEGLKTCVHPSTRFWRIRESQAHI